MDTLRGIVGLGNLALMLATAVILVAFTYRVFLRKFFRARRIANLRLERIMREKSQ